MFCYHPFMFFGKTSLSWLTLAYGLLAFSSLSACTAAGVGDPCKPEVVPRLGDADGGTSTSNFAFSEDEIYFETNSAQCRTRICMAYRYGGNPYVDPDQKAVNERIYCTCRCGAPAGSTATTCKCPDGFTCAEINSSDLAGPGLQGSYCVRDSNLR